MPPKTKKYGWFILFNDDGEWNILAIPNHANHGLQYFNIKKSAIDYCNQLNKKYNPQADLGWRYRVRRRPIE